MSLGPITSVRQHRLILLTKAEELNLGLADAIDRLPRAQRYRYGQRLECSLWRLIELIIEAACSGTKSRVYRLDEHIRVLRALIRFGANRKLLSAKRTATASITLGEIGAMVHSWKAKLQ